MNRVVSRRRRRRRRRRRGRVDPGASGEGRPVEYELGGLGGKEESEKKTWMIMDKGGVSGEWRALCNL